jgi:hypothetical protein
MRACDAGESIGLHVGKPLKRKKEDKWQVTRQEMRDGKVREEIRENK